MTDTKHTPGPWRHNGDCCGAKPHWHEIAITTKTIAHIFCSTPDEDNANAHLIAAAPDLLEALEHLVYWAEDFLEDGDADEAKAAIAKAKGGTK